MLLPWSNLPVKNSPKLLPCFPMSESVFSRFFPETDPINPSHYRTGSQEAIITIEDAIAEAPNNQAAFLHGQALKYLLRLWLKGQSLEDAKKARWYLERLIGNLED
ncbi:MAG: DUF3310 domain-containing protein [Verrucomicrobia bacterium]|nr:DUF3310 domain-containing protein [Verrucomicrobiota bacterium]